MRLRRIRPNERKKSPSLAMARITRDAPSRIPLIAPRIETEISRERASAAPGPNAWPMAAAAVRHPAFVGVVMVAMAGLLVSTLPTWSFKNFRVPRDYVLPLLLGALGRNAEGPQGAQSLLGALQRDHMDAAAPAAQGIGGLDLGGLLGSVLGGGMAGGAGQGGDAVHKAAR